MHYDDSPWSIPYGEFTAYHGFNDNKTTTNPIKGVTADGETQLRLWLGEYKSISSYKVECDYPGDWGQFSAPQKDKASNQYYMIYTAPNWEDMSYPSGYEVTPSITLHVVEDDGGHYEQTVNVPELKILPPSIALIHGVAGEIEGCFGEFYQWLLSEGYEEYQIQKIDYKPSHNNSFEFNTFSENVIANSLNDLYKKLLDKGILSSRYILCGHSMGGILSRYYAQYLRPESVYKIITLDTPHWGSELADFGKDKVLTLTNKFKNTPPEKVLNNAYVNGQGSLAAYRDLATTSTAIRKMNNEGLENLQGIGCHAVCSYFDDISDSKSRSVSDIPVLTLRQKATHDVNHLVLTTMSMAKSRMKEEQNPLVQRKRLDELYKDTYHDGVVALHSQRGGLASQYCTMQTAPFKGLYGRESMAHHINTNKWETTYENLLRLFLLPLSDKCFSTTGFLSPENSSYSFDKSRSEPVESIDWKIGSSTSHNITIDDVKIDDLEMKVTISASSEIENNMIVVQADEELTDSDSNSTDYTIQFDQETKKIEIVVIGRTSNYELYYDYKVINL